RAHPVRCERLQRIAGGAAGGERRRPRADRNERQRTLAVQRVAQPAYVRDAEEAVHGRVPQVGVDQQNPPLIRFAERQRDVRGGERLAFARRRARHHDHFEVAFQLRLMDGGGQLVVLLAHNRRDRGRHYQLVATPWRRKRQRSVGVGIALAEAHWNASPDRQRLAFRWIDWQWSGAIAFDVPWGNNRRLPGCEKPDRVAGARLI